MSQMWWFPNPRRQFTKNLVTDEIHPEVRGEQPDSPDDQLEKQNRPVMREEDLIGARETLGSKGPLRSKTFEVMDECERAGKAAPSVFSGVRSGAETAFQKPPAHSKKT